MIIVHFGVVDVVLCIVICCPLSINAFITFGRLPFVEMALLGYLPISNTMEQVFLKMYFSNCKSSNITK